MSTEAFWFSYNLHIEMSHDKIKDSGFGYSNSL